MVNIHILVVVRYGIGCRSAGRGDAECRYIRVRVYVWWVRGGNIWTGKELEGQRGWPNRLLDL